MLINNHIRAAPDTFKYTKIPGNPGGRFLFAPGEAPFWLHNPE
jgi:hypothetical protein